MNEEILNFATSCNISIQNSNSTITTIPQSANYVITKENIEDSIMRKLLEKFSSHPISQHKCNNCGASVEIDIKKHIFICKYCGSAYAIGTAQLNDLGG